MDKITISDGATTITMPRTKKITIGGENVCKEKTMASGKNVRDVVGHRVIVDGEWDYVPAATMTALITLIRTGAFLFVEYPDSTGDDADGMFDVSVPSPGIFKFVGGVPMWHGARLKMTAQEVI